MNIIQFKYAIEVERTGSISQAAENLYMAQPNLSKAIRELEETLGFPVFERTSRGVVPTRRGEEFLKLARGVLLQVEHCLLYTSSACRSWRSVWKTIR